MSARQKKYMPYKECSGYQGWTYDKTLVSLEVDRVQENLKLNMEQLKMKIA